MIPPCMDHALPAVRPNGLCFLALLWVLVDQLSNWLTGWSADCLTYFLTDCLTH